MFDLDVLIKKLVLARGLHGPIECCACIIDGEGKKIIHATVEPPFVDFHETPEGSFIEIVFHGDDPEPSPKVRTGNVDGPPDPS
jgi:hypothetical protein